MHTYIDDESRAYNTYTGSHSRSNRKGLVRFMGTDQLVRVTLGVPDTYFSIPAHTRWHGKYISGFITTSQEEGLPYWVFWPLSKYEDWIVQTLRN